MPIIANVVILRISIYVIIYNFKNFKTYKLDMALDFRSEEKNYSIIHSNCYDLSFTIKTTTVLNWIYLYS
jgi:hypothetical protein